MLFTENIFVALAGLKANIMRSLLTMLGIIIGIASVIAIMTVGNSITLIVNTTMQDLGANNLELGVMQKSMDKETLATGASYGAGYARSMTEQDLITEDMITAFREEFPDNIKYIIKQEQVGDKTTVTDGNKTANIKIVGSVSKAFFVIIKELPNIITATNKRILPIIPNFLSLVITTLSNLPIIYYF